MSHSITFHCVYFELSTVSKRETIDGSRSRKSSPVVFNLILAQQIATNRKKSQKTDWIDCDFFPNEKIDLNGSVRKRWNFHLRLSAKRLLFYFSAKFGPFSNPFGGRASAVHDERAESTCSRNIVCSKM